MKALNLLIKEKEECIDNLKELIEDTCQTDELEVQQERLEAEIELLTEKINSVIRENTRIVQDRKDKRGILTNFIMNLQDLDGEQVEFREELWGGLLDEIVAEKDKSCRVIFRGGIEVTI